MTTIRQPTACVMNCGRGATQPIMPIAFQGGFSGSSKIEWIHPDCYRRFLAGVAHLDAVRSSNRGSQQS